MNRIVNRDVQWRVFREIYDLAQKTAGGLFSGDASAALNFDNDYTSDTIEDIVDTLSRNNGVLAAYLADHGKTLEPTRKGKEWDGFGNELLQAYINEVGPQRLAQYVAEMETGNAYEVFQEQKNIGPKIGLISVHAPRGRGDT